MSLMNSSEEINKMRCQRCKRVLCYYKISIGYVQVKCKMCGHLTEIKKDLQKIV